MRVNPCSFGAMLYLGLIASIAFSSPMVSAQSQGQNFESVTFINIKALPDSNNGPSYTPPPAPSPAPTPPTSPPSTPPPPNISQPPIHPPSGPFSPPIVVQTDLTHQTNGLQVLLVPPNAPPVIEGIAVLADKSFPAQVDSKQPADGILVRAKENTLMERPSPHSVKLNSGSILVSVRRPSRLGLITTPMGDVALSSDGEVVVSASEGIVHILNASARGSGCKIRLSPSDFEKSKKRTFAIQPGYEFTVGDRRLTRRDLRPTDGIARRRVQLFEEGKIALSEFSVHGLLANCALVANLQQKDNGAKERRILADLSKMAAVLNQVHGATGYTCAGPTQVAANGQIQ